jgi:hypothetical protein
MHHATTPVTPAVQIPPIEDHPDYATLVRMAALDSDVLRHDLAAARWVAGLLATIAKNAKSLQGQ